MSEEKIDWAAAMSGERPVTGCNGDTHRVLCIDRPSSSTSTSGPIVTMNESGCIFFWAEDGTRDGLRLTQSPKVIEWTEYQIPYEEESGIIRFSSLDHALKWPNLNGRPIVPVTYRICGDQVTVSGGTK